MTEQAGEDSAELRYARELALLRDRGRAARRRIEGPWQRPLRTVLIADANAMMRALLSATLSPESYDIVEADSGAATLSLAMTECPSLVLLDAALPGIDGFEVCRKIRSEPRLTDTSVILLGEDATASGVRRGREVGTDRYMTKPFSPIELLEAIEELVS
jgi:DNA-binding response OmpR family regulator